MIKGKLKGNSPSPSGRFTFVLVPHASSDSVKALTIPGLLIQTTAILLVISIAVTTFVYVRSSSIEYGLQSEQQKSAALTKENDLHKAQIKMLNNKLAEQEQKLNDIDLTLSDLAELASGMKALTSESAGSKKQAADYAKMGESEEEEVISSGTASASRSSNASRSAGFSVSTSGLALHQEENSLKYRNNISSSELNYDSSSERSLALKQTLLELSISMDDVKKYVAAKPTFWPINSVRITSPFGSRVDPINNRTLYHHGMDVGAKDGQYVYAAGGGTVVFADRTSIYGKMIVIDHQYSIETLYGHLSMIKVKPGDVVKKGQVIGYAGNTGRSTGPHLHYEIKKNGVSVDPLDYTTAEFKSPPSK